MAYLNTSDIFDEPENMRELEDFFIGVASCAFFDGDFYTLYLDLEDGEVFWDVDTTMYAPIEDDERLAVVAQIQGYCDTPEAKRFNSNSTLENFGFDHWLGLIREHVENLLIEDQTKDEHHARQHYSL